MTTKRTYGSRDEVCHAFAHQQVHHGKAGNIFFHGKLIYSYGLHFCMARLVGDSTVLITTQSYSMSTASHLSKLRSAVSHKRRIYTWSPENPFTWDAIEHTMRQVHERIAEAGNRQKHRLDLRDADLQAARGIYDDLEQLRQRAKTWPKEETEGWSPWPRYDSVLAKKWKALGKLLSGEFDGIVAARAKQTQREAKAEAKRRAAAEAKRLEALRIDRERGEEQLQLWLDHQPIEGRNFMRCLDHHGLRLAAGSQTVVETTLGQTVPAADCIAAWPLLKTVYESGRYKGEGYRIGSARREMKFGGFQADFIDTQGNLRVGCHTFKAAMVYRLAVELGLS